MLVSAISAYTESHLGYGAAYIRRALRKLPEVECDGPLDSL